MKVRHLAMLGALVVMTALPVHAQEAVHLEGQGQTATAPFYPPAEWSVAQFTHDGRRNFIVKSFGGPREELLVNTIGSYTGARPIHATDPRSLDIDADGAWTVQIDPIGIADGAAFSGHGDAVGGWFDPPGSGPWTFTHDGQKNFIARAHCAGGDVLAQNVIGALDASRVMQFRGGPCFWEVEADGNWSLAPR